MRIVLTADIATDCARRAAEAAPEGEAAPEEAAPEGYHRRRWNSRGNITPQSFSWKPGTPYPTVSTTYVRWKNLFNNAQTTLDFRLIYINSAIVDDKFIIRNFKYPSNIGYVTKDPYSGKWYIDLDASQIPQGTFAEQLIMVHELYHLHLYLKAGVTKPTSSDNDDHHRQMVEDGIYVEWLKKCFQAIRMQNTRR